MKNSESEEMYLETILLLKNSGKRARPIDVATQLGYSRPSVSRAVNILKQGGYVSVGSDGELNLTEVGRARAEDIYDRHKIICDLLVMTGAERSLAEENACRIEHVISPELFEVLKRFVKEHS